MALFALLFALTPALEAMACAAEGCDVACTEQADGAQASLNDESVPGDCAEDHCICAASHCNHMAIPAPEAGASLIIDRHSRGVPIVAPNLVSSTPQTPDRPPRA